MLDFYIFAVNENKINWLMKDYRVVHIERLIIDGDTKTALLQLSKFLEQFESDSSTPKNPLTEGTISLIFIFVKSIPVVSRLFSEIIPD